MTEMNEPASQPQSATVTPAATPEAAQPSLGLADFLREFEAETAKPAAPPQPTATESTPDAPAAGVPDAPATLEAAIKALDSDTNYRASAEMRAAMGNFASIVQSIQQQQLIERDHRDFDAVIAKAGKALEAQGLPVNEEEIKRWFVSENALNGEVSAAWERRYMSADDQRRYARQERKAFERLADSIKHRADPDITAERNAIVASVMKTGSGKPPPAKAPDYGSLNDAEFRNELKKLGLT